MTREKRVRRSEWQPGVPIAKLLSKLNRKTAKRYDIITTGNPNGIRVIKKKLSR